MEIKYGSVFGNFKWEAIAEIPEGLVPTLCALGALQVAQRTPSSAAEKALAGYEKRPTGFKRDSIDFSDAAAATLAKHLEAMKVETGRDEKDAPIFATIDAAVTVEKYEGSTADVKMVDERAVYGRNAEKLEKLAATVDYKGELGNGKAEEAPIEFIRAIRAYSKKLLAALGTEEE